MQTLKNTLKEREKIQEKLEVSSASIVCTSPLVWCTATALTTMYSRIGTTFVAFSWSTAHINNYSAHLLFCCLLYLALAINVLRYVFISFEEASPASLSSVTRVLMVQIHNDFLKA